MPDQAICEGMKDRGSTKQNPPWSRMRSGGICIKPVRGQERSGIKKAMRHHSSSYLYKIIPDTAKRGIGRGKLSSRPRADALKRSPHVLRGGFFHYSEIKRFFNRKPRKNTTGRGSRWCLVSNASMRSSRLPASQRRSVELPYPRCCSSGSWIPSRRRTRPRLYPCWPRSCSRSSSSRRTS